MLLAEVSPTTELIAGGGVTGMLVVVMTAMLRRTKDTDTRRDEITNAVMDSAREREDRAWAARDSVIVERDEARAEVARLRRLLEERPQWTNTTPTSPERETPPPSGPSP